MTAQDKDILALLAGRNFSEAVQKTTAMSEQAPIPQNFWMLCYALLRSKKYTEVFQASLKWADICGSSASQMSFLSLSLFNLGRVEQAIRAAIAASKLDASDAFALMALARKNAQEGNFETAINCLDQAIELKPDEIMFYIAKSDLLYAQGEDDKNINFLQSGIGQCAEDVELKSRLGALLSGLGQGQKAQKILLEAIHSIPSFGAPYRHFSALSSDIESEILSRAQGISDSQTQNPEDRMHMNFGLGKFYEARRKFKDSFEAYDLANRIRRNGFTYNVEKDIAAIQAHQDRCTQVLPFDSKSPVRITDFKPIFIVGLPRSGSSLLEKILAQHPDIEDVGETPALSFVIATMAVEHGTDWMFRQDSSLIDKARLLYQAKIKEMTDKAIFTDKMLSNFRYLGLIRVMFPEAVVINCLRQPLPNGWAIFTQYFSEHQPFAYSQTEIGKYILGYRKVMEKWEILFPEWILNVTYESVVGNAIREIEPVFKRLGLDISDLPEKYSGTLDKKKGGRTASNIQVQQEVYTTSVDRWENYSPYLSELKEVLSSGKL